MTRGKIIVKLLLKVQSKMDEADYQVLINTMSVIKHEKHIEFLKYMLNK